MPLYVPKTSTPTPGQMLSLAIASNENTAAIERLSAELAALEQRLAALEQRLAALENE